MSIKEMELKGISINFKLLSLKQSIKEMELKEISINFKLLSLKQFRRGAGRAEREKDTGRETPHYVRSIES